jgi:site-specific recombinase XerD
MQDLDVVFKNEPNDSTAIRSRIVLEVKVAKTQEALINDWFGALGRDVTAGRLGIGSYRAAVRDVRPWQVYLEEIGCADPTQTTVEDFLALQATRYRVNTVNNRRDTLSGLYAWAQAQPIPRYTDIVAAVPRQARSLAELPPESGDSDLVIALLAMMGRRDLRDLRNRVIVGLVGSGLETHSIHLAVIGDVDDTNGEIRYQPRRHDTKDATIRLRAEVAEAMREYLAARRAGGTGDPDVPLITPSYDLTVPLSTLSMRLLIRRLADGLGVGRGRLTTTALRTAGVGEMTQRLGVSGVVRTARMSRDSLRRILRRVVPRTTRIATCAD